MPPTHPAQILLNRAHSPTTAEEIVTTKLKSKPLLLRPNTTHVTGTDSRALRRHIRLHQKEYYLRHQRPRPLSAKQKRELGLRDLPKNEINYELYLGLHGLWVGYMHEILGFNNTSGKKEGMVIDPQRHGTLLATADFHGAEIEVVKSKCVDRVGIRGIVVKDTKFTFVVVTRENRVRVLPKGGAVFRYTVPLPRIEEEEVEDGGDIREGRREYVFELHGSQFEMRAAHRANRKFKWKRIEGL